MTVQAPEAHKCENFPVASWFLPRKHRLRIKALYDFARGADNIADDPGIEKEERLQQLDHVKMCFLEGKTDPVPIWATPLAGFVKIGNCPAEYPAALIEGFSQEVITSRYPDQDAVMHISYATAAPVGRALLALCDEPEADLEASDALCMLLQLIDYLQDIKEDYHALGRIYLPQDWLNEVQASEAMFAEPYCSPALRCVINRMLEICEDLHAKSGALIPTLRSWRLRIEVRVIRHLCKRLIHALYLRDPLAEKVRLGKSILTRSSFYWPLQCMGMRKRHAMKTLYAFCRAVDDGVDLADDKAVAAENLAFWRRETDLLYTGKPIHPISQALQETICDFSLPRLYFDALLDAQAMDIDGKMHVPSLEQLTRYCDGVAGAVGLLSVRIFGFKNGQADAFAIALGRALQLTNILRDLKEDNERGRCYLAREWFDGRQAESEFAPGLALLCTDQYYTEAYKLSKTLNRWQLLPALLMYHVYRERFVRLAREAKLTRF